MANNTQQVIARAYNDIETAARKEIAAMVLNDKSHLIDVSLFARQANRALRHLGNAAAAMEQAPATPDQLKDVERF